MTAETLIFLFFICFFSTGIGRISGAGGGVLIKPALDVSAVFTVPATSLLSSFGVWAMTACTLVRVRKNPIPIQWTRTLLLSLGAALGGSVGHILFAVALQHLSHSTLVGRIQNAILLLLMVVIAVSLHWNWKLEKPLSNLFCVPLGLLLGTCSAFLGIGGGPLNVAVLSLLLAMEPKEAALHSLLIIFFSQSINLMPYLFEPVFPVSPVALPIAGVAGFLGATTGEWFSNRLSPKQVQKLFTCILLFVSILACINLFRL